MPLAVLDDRHGVDPRRRAGDRRRRLGEDHELGALVRRQVDELVEQVERGGLIQQHRTALDGPPERAS